MTDALLFVLMLLFTLLILSILGMLRMRRQHEELAAWLKASEQRHMDRRMQWAELERKLSEAERRDDDRHAN